MDKSLQKRIYIQMQNSNMFNAVLFLLLLIIKEYRRIIYASTNNRQTRQINNEAKRRGDVSWISWIRLQLGIYSLTQMRDKYDRIINLRICGWLMAYSVTAKMILLLHRIRSEECFKNLEASPNLLYLLFHFITSAMIFRLDRHFVFICTGWNEMEFKNC